MNVLPVGVSVAHGVVARVLLVLLIHFKADSLNAPLLRLVLLAAVLAGRQGGRLVGIVRQRAPLFSRDLGGFSDGRQEAAGETDLLTFYPLFEAAFFKYHIFN